jgi:hypothetical protein
MQIKPAAKGRFQIDQRQIMTAVLVLVLAGLLALAMASAKRAGAAAPPHSPGLGNFAAGSAAGVMDLPAFSGPSRKTGAPGAAPAAPAPAATPTCGPDWSVVNTPNDPAHASSLLVAAEVGPNDVWAAGYYLTDALTPAEWPFFEHWNGTAWTLIPAPIPAGGQSGRIWGMSVNSSSDVWAVGSYSSGTNTFELIERWNGIQWSAITGASPSGSYNRLLGVAVVSTNNVWAVGDYVSGGQGNTLVEHWDGANWMHVASPNQGTGNNTLQDVSVVPGSSGNDIWAVGYYFLTPAGTKQTLTLHYSGSTWSPVASYNQGTGDNLLNGVRAISANDVWAVGDYLSGPTIYPLAEHWNGSAWTLSPTPNPGNSNAFVRVFATASNDVWAAGYNIGPSTSAPLIEHWNGSTWSISTNAGVGYSSQVVGITGGSSGDIWAVGTYLDTAASAGGTLAEHYNGTAWSPVYTPTPPAGIDSLWSVSAVSATDIWAVGSTYSYIGAQQLDQALIEHWDGTKWSIVTGAHPTVHGDRLNGVSALSTNDVWAVGYYANTTNHQTFIEHWNGSTWSQITSPSPGGSGNNNDLNGVDAASANDMWAVGSYFNGTANQTLILHWDGTALLPVTSPSPGFLEGVTVVPGSGGNDAWAVGYYRDPVSSHYASLLERWNGSAWSVVSAPDVQGADNQPQSIFALSANDVGAVGFTYASASPSQNLALHWNGTAWSIVPVAQQGPYSNELTGVTGTASNDVYAVGDYRDASAQERGLIEHWNGSAWSVVPGVQAPGLDSLFAGVTAVSSSDVWAVGEYSQLGFEGWQPLVMRYHPCVVSCNISFTDVPVGSTFYPYIHCLACLGIINGYPDGTFKPNANVTRGQLSKIVANSAGFNDAQPNQMFQDVPVGSTFQVFIGRLASRGYINGYACGGAGEPCVPPGNLPYFRPNANATRGQISKIDANAAGFSDTPSGQQFQDVPVGSTYYTYTFRLVSRTIMAGYACGGAGEPCVPPGNLPYFRPNNNATRGQTSKIVSGTFFPDCSALGALRP